MSARARLRQADADRDAALALVQLGDVGVDVAHRGHPGGLGDRRRTEAPRRAASAWRGRMTSSGRPAGSAAAGRPAPRASRIWRSSSAAARPAFAGSLAGQRPCCVAGGALEIEEVRAARPGSRAALGRSPCAHLGCRWSRLGVEQDGEAGRAQVAAARRRRRTDRPGAVEPTWVKTSVTPAGLHGSGRPAGPCCSMSSAVAGRALDVDVQVVRVARRLEAGRQQGDQERSSRRRSGRPRWTAMILVVQRPLQGVAVEARHRLARVSAWVVGFRK